MSNHLDVKRLVHLLDGGQYQLACCTTAVDAIAQDSDADDSPRRWRSVTRYRSAKWGDVPNNAAQIATDRAASALDPELATAESNAR